MIDEEDSSTVWKALYEHSKQKRESNRMGSTKMLENNKIPFKALNNGAHLVIQYDTPKIIIDFWPGTGLFRVRHVRPEYKSRGVRNLLKYIQNRVN